MKYKIGKDGEFNPVSFTITCETEDDLNRWFALFNHQSFTDFIGDNDNFFEVLQGRGASADAYFNTNIDQLIRGENNGNK